MLERKDIRTFDPAACSGDRYPKGGDASRLRPRPSGRGDRAGPEGAAHNAEIRFLTSRTTWVVFTNPPHGFRRNPVRLGNIKVWPHDLHGAGGSPEAVMRLAFEDASCMAVGESCGAVKDEGCFGGRHPPHVRCLFGLWQG